MLCSPIHIYFMYFISMYMHMYVCSYICNLYGRIKGKFCATNVMYVAHPAVLQLPLECVTTSHWNALIPGLFMCNYSL